LKTRKFTDRGVGNKFSRIAKVAKPNDNGKIKVTSWSRETGKRPLKPPS
jgi:hypothetical protein